MGKTRLVFNAPAVMIITIISGMITILDPMSGGALNKYFFSSYPSSLFDLLFWFRLIFNFLGHQSMYQYLNNISLFVLTGSILEQKYGSRLIVIAVFCTSILAGLVNMIFTRVTILGVGATDFAFIILLAMSQCKKHQITTSFVFVLLFYGAAELYNAVFMGQGSSVTGHLCGCLVGLILGIILRDYTKD